MGRTALALWALWAFSASCLASETPAAASQRTGTTALSIQGGTVADLDGDSRPDLAIVEAEGWGPRGFQYRIVLDLTTRGAPTSFGLTAEEGGLGIVARDVDGDRDLDLVITSAQSFAPVGVWINDGHGSFTQGDLSVYPRSIAREDRSIFPCTPQEAVQAAIPETRRPCAGCSAASFFHKGSPFEPLTFVAGHANPPRILVRPPQSRAPPLSIP